MKCPQHGTEHGHTSGRETCCPDCGDWWQGARAAHCVKCHRTYETLGDFTKHQKMSKGMVIRCDGRGLKLYKPRETPLQLAQDRA